MQQDFLYSEDIFYALGTFLITFSYSVGLLFRQVKAVPNFIFGHNFVLNNSASPQHPQSEPGVQSVGGVSDLGRIFVPQIGMRQRRRAAGQRPQLRGQQVRTQVNNSLIFSCQSAIYEKLKGGG